MGVTFIDLGPTATWKSRTCLWLSPGDPFDGWATISCVGREAETTTYGVSRQDGVIAFERLADAVPDGMPEAIAKARRESDERRETYLVDVLDGLVIRCSCRANSHWTCKHRSATKQLIKRGLI